MVEERRTTGALRVLAWLVVSLVFTVAGGGVVILVMSVPSEARTLADRERRPRLTVAEVTSARPNTLACLEGRVAAVPGGVAAHEHWERSSQRGGTRLVSKNHPVIWLEQDGQRAALRAGTYVLEQVGRGERAMFGTVEELLQVRSGEVIAAYGSTTGDRLDGAPVFEARVVVLGPAEAGLAAQRENLRTGRIFGWTSAAVLTPMGAWLLHRRRRRAAASAA